MKSSSWDGKKKTSTIFDLPFMDRARKTDLMNTVTRNIGRVVRFSWYTRPNDGRKRSEIPAVD
jgi:hypothetical protein